MYHGMAESHLVAVQMIWFPICMALKFPVCLSAGLEIKMTLNFASLTKADLTEIHTLYGPRSLIQCNSAWTKSLMIYHDCFLYAYIYVYCDKWKGTTGGPSQRWRVLRFPELSMDGGSYLEGKTLNVVLDHCASLISLHALCNSLSSTKSLESYRYLSDQQHWPVANATKQKCHIICDVGRSRWTDGGLGLLSLISLRQSDFGEPATSTSVCLQVGLGKCTMRQVWYARCRNGHRELKRAYLWNQSI